MHCCVFLQTGYEQNYLNRKVLLFCCTVVLLSCTHLAHGLKKLLDKCNILCKQLWHAAREYG